MKVAQLLAVSMALVSLSLPACSKLAAQYQEESEGHGQQSEEAGHEGGSHEESAEHGEGHGEGEEGHGAHIHKVIVTSPIRKDLVDQQEYVCQIHSRRHIEVRSLEGGYLQEIPIREGQEVKKGDLLFRILPTLYKARYDSELAEAQLRQIEYNNTKKLFDQNVVSQQQVSLAQAKLNQAKAKVELSKAELDFTEIRAQFDGIVDRLHEMKGSLISEGDILTTMSDNHLMWVYFNVPEAHYLEYMENMDENREEMKIELKLANHKMFPYPGEIGAIEADFNNKTGNIAFRADFPNPKRLLRYGQTGNIVISRDLENVIVIPQRATFEILAKRYVWVVDEDHIVHQREIEVSKEFEDLYVISEGVSVDDKIIWEGVRQVRDGEKVKFEFRAPEEILEDLKYMAQ